MYMRASCIFLRVYICSILVYFSAPLNPCACLLVRLSACSICLTLELPLNTNWQEMGHVGLGPSIVVYGAAMSALANGKQWALALDLLREVRYVVPSTPGFYLHP